MLLIKQETEITFPFLPYIKVHTVSAVTILGIRPETVNTKEIHSIQEMARELEMETQDL